MAILEASVKEELISKDQQLLWHPFTKGKVINIPIKNARGAYVYGEDGKSYMDLISSWWVNLHGHSNSVIAEAIYSQAKTLEHVMFGGFTHRPAIELCEKLSTVLPENLTKFFFSDNGSTAVEVALKAAYQYWINKGHKGHTVFMCFEKAYHGDTVGAMSVGSSSGYHNCFSGLFFETFGVPYPATWQGDQDVEKKEEQVLSLVESYLEKNNDKIAAFIMEPLVQGAGGMRMCRESFLNNLISLLRRYEVIVIFDEVMTGFGRTGANFAADRLECSPDIMCLSKGITGGSLPLAVTVVTQEIYCTFEDENCCFTHGHSYTANPLACAAGCASFDLFMRASSAIKAIEDIHVRWMAELSQGFRELERFRCKGTVMAFEVAESKVDKMPNIEEEFISNGFIVRPLGNVIYLLPPYCVSADELNYAYKKIRTMLRIFVY